MGIDSVPAPREKNALHLEEKNCGSIRQLTEQKSLNILQLHKFGYDLKVIKMRERAGVYLCNHVSN